MNRAEESSIRVLALAALALGATGRASAQTGGVPTQNQKPAQSLTGLLKHFAEQSDEVNATMPNILCRETGTSTEYKANGDVKKKVSFAAEVRVVRQSDGRFRETFMPHMFDGKAFDERKKKWPMPIYMEGGFRNPFAYLDSDAQHCMRYELRGRRLQFETSSGATAASGCKRVVKGLKGFALLNDQGDLLHVERQVPLEASIGLNLVEFAGSDFLPVTLRDHVYHLSSHVLGRNDSESVKVEFEASYTECKLFGSTSTFLPGPGLVQDEAPVTPVTPK